MRIVRAVSQRAPVTHWRGNVRKELVIVAAVVVGLLLAGFGFWYVSGSAERTAREACAEAIKGDIENPGSAQFRYELVWDEGGTWHVNGHVDARTRQSFRCDVKDGIVTDHYAI